MVRRRVLSTFVITLGVLALLVGVSLRKAKAAGGSTPTTNDTTTVVYHPVAGLTRAEDGAVHVVNLGRDANAPAERFRIMFVDPRGVLYLPEQVCDIRAGETCTVIFPGSNCPPPALKGRCEFRAVVVGDQMPCVTPNMGTGDWMTNLELVTAGAGSKYIAGETKVLHLPTDACTPEPDISVTTTVPSIDSGVTTTVPSIDSGATTTVPSIDSGATTTVPSIDSGATTTVPSIDAPAIDAFTHH